MIYLDEEDCDECSHGEDAADRKIIEAEIERLDGILRKDQDSYYLEGNMKDRLTVSEHFVIWDRCNELRRKLSERG